MQRIPPSAGPNTGRNSRRAGSKTGTWLSVPLAMAIPLPSGRYRIALGTYLGPLGGSGASGYALPVAMSQRRRMASCGASPPRAASVLPSGETAITSVACRGFSMVRTTFPVAASRKAIRPVVAAGDDRPPVRGDGDLDHGVRVCRPPPQLPAGGRVVGVHDVCGHGQDVPAVRGERVVPAMFQPGPSVIGSGLPVATSHRRMWFSWLTVSSTLPSGRKAARDCSRASRGPHGGFPCRWPCPTSAGSCRRPR